MERFSSIHRHRHHNHCVNDGDDDDDEYGYLCKENYLLHSKRTNFDSPQRKFLSTTTTRSKFTVKPNHPPTEGYKGLSPLEKSDQTVTIIFTMLIRVECSEHPSPTLYSASRNGD
jgi:hypothetical protein